MSRCFRFPPPGFTVSREKEEAWLEGIKLHKEKLRRKLERREKKKKKKEEKSRKMRKQMEDKTNKKSSHVSEQSLQSNVRDTEGDLVQSRGETDNQHLVGSCLTEDHGVSGAYCSSPDSTGNSHKGNRNSVTETDDNGNDDVQECDIFAKELELFLTDSTADLASQDKIGVGTGEEKKKSCSTSNETRSSNQGNQQKKHLISRKVEAIAPPKATLLPRQEVGSQDKDGACTGEGLKMFCSTSKATRSSDQGFHPITNQEKKHLIAKKIEVVAPPKAVMLSFQEPVHYLDLVNNSVQPQLQNVPLPADDPDWLSKCRINGQNKRRFKDARTNYRRNSSMWPQVDFLPEINGLALPYTIPF